MKRLGQGGAVPALFGFLGNSMRTTAIPFFLCFCAGACLGVSDFTVEVVATSAGFNPQVLYKDPQAILGKPTLRCQNDPSNPNSSGDPNYLVKIVEAASYLSDTSQQVVTTINAADPFFPDLLPEDWIIVKFDHKVLDYPKNPFGCDLIVFGNAFFEDDENEGSSDSSNMNTWTLTNPAQIYAEKVQISVSQDGNTWYAFDPNAGPWANDPQRGPWADQLFPTQAYQWDKENACWLDEEMDFTLPVDPNLTLSNFSGLTVAQALELYNGSGGGAGFDLQNLFEYEQLTIDPETGFRWIQYVRLEGGTGLDAVGGEVDALSDVAGCGDPQHPYPVGDLNQDCRINLEDLSLFAAQWQKQNCGTCGGADLSGPADGNVTLSDLVVFSGHWMQCTYRCQ